MLQAACCRRQERRLHIYVRMQTRESATTDFNFPRQQVESLIQHLRRVGEV